MYIILRGKAREFVPKSIDEIEEESRTKYGGFQYLQGVPISLPELRRTETQTSLNTISEENDEAGTSEITKKRFRKLKAVLPFLTKMNHQKGSVQQNEDYRYKKSIKKVRSIVKPILAEEDINLEALETEYGCHVVEEFTKYPRAYFIGGIVKVRFLKYLTAGSHCGIKALKDNSLRPRAVFAEEDCHCVTLNRDDFNAVLNNEKVLNMDKIEFFRKMFGMIDEKVIIEFAMLWESFACKVNDYIFQQNEPSKYLYVLCSGEAMVTNIHI